MKSFRQYLQEAFLLENKAWHQFVGQNAKKLLDRAGLSTTYMNIGNEPGHGTPEHVTNYLSDQLGMKDLNTDEGRWVLKHLHGGGIQRAEDVASTVVPNLMRLRQARAEGKSDANLARIQGAGALHAHLAKVYPAGESSLAHLDPSEYTVHGENEHWTVVQPHTKAAACAVGKGSNWCTASTGTHNMFEHYNEHGPLYALIPKNPVRKGERYQLHVPYHTSAPENPDQIQFMDENDDPVHEQQQWSPLSSQHTEDSSLTPEAKKAGDRPLPEIENKLARGAIHGVRDLMDFRHAVQNEKPTDILSTRLNAGSASNTPEDTINAAIIKHSRAYTPAKLTNIESSSPGFGIRRIQDALTKNGGHTVQQALNHINEHDTKTQRAVLDDSTMERLQTHPNPMVRLQAARKKWKPEHVMRAAQDPDPNVALNALPYFDTDLDRKITPEHIDTLIRHPDYRVRENVIHWGMPAKYDINPNTKDFELVKGTQRLTHDHIDKLAADPDERIRWKLAQHNHSWALSPAHVHTMLQHSNPTQDNGERRPNPPHPSWPAADHLDYWAAGGIMSEKHGNLLYHMHPRVQLSRSGKLSETSGQLFRQLITGEHITRALQNPDKYHPLIRQMLLHHNQFDPAVHMDLAKQNTDLDLRKTQEFPHGDATS